MDDVTFCDFALRTIHSVWTTHYRGHVSREGQVVLFAINNGMRISIPKHVKNPRHYIRLVDGYPKFNDGKFKPAIPVPEEIFDELEPLLHKLTEHDENSRGGASSTGLDVNIADYYCMKM